MKGLYWFRNDLRLQDNSAFAAAVNESSDLAAVYFIPIQTWLSHHYAAIKVNFILRELNALRDNLQSWGITLWVYTVKTFDDEIVYLNNLCVQHHFKRIYAVREYEWDERCRDDKVATELAKHKIEWQLFDDNLICAPGAILNQAQKPFQVFTPFKRAWLQTIDNGQLKPITVKKRLFKLFQNDTTIPASIEEFPSTFNLSSWPRGEKGALQRLATFCHKKISHYDVDRDYPSLNNTSHLSAYLALGIISPRQCIHAAYQQRALLSADDGVETWVSELIWREFYKHIVYFFPQVCRYQAFKKQTDRLPWCYDKALFSRWCEGQTGFPLVDAAMRQLQQTGFMHNRLRMVVAMFLSKTLFIDWRWGEKYFMQNLIDGDFAANNGGWQWSASTGTDAVPYFRIFNPIRQSERFDAQGEFIRRYCPELAHLDARTIHMPYRRGIALGTLDYPKPMVNESESHKRTIQLFKALMD